MFNMKADRWRMDGGSGGYGGKLITYPPSLKKEQVMSMKIREENDIYRTSIRFKFPATARLHQINY